MKTLLLKLTISLCILLLLYCESITHRSRLIKIGVSHPPEHSFVKAARRFGDHFEKQTKGRYRVKVYASAQLGNEKEMQEMLTIGTLEATITGVVNTYEPLFAVFELPYLYRDREHVKQVNFGPIMQEVADALIPKGIRLVGFYENGLRNITNSVRPIHSPADVKGLKIRTPENPAQIETFKALGAIATPLSFSELFTALLQGVVDGQENPLQNIYTNRLHEAQQYLAMTHHIYNSAYFLVSERFWQTLPADDQQTFLSCVTESSEWQLNYMKKLDVELEQKLKAEGVEFTYPDKNEFEKACQPAYEKLCSKLGPQAYEIVRKIKSLK